MTKPNKVDNEKSIFAKNLEKLLDNRKKTTGDLARFASISSESVRKYLNDNVSPSADILKKIAEFFGVSSDYLIGLAEIESKNMTNREINKETGLSNKAIELLRLATSDKAKYKYIRCINALVSDEGLHVIDGIVDYLRLKNNEFSVVPDYGDSVYFGIKPQKDKSFLLSSEDVSLFKFIKIQNALIELKSKLKGEDK